MKSLKRTLLILTLVIFSVSVLSYDTSAQSQVARGGKFWKTTKGQNYVPGEVLVTYKKSASASAKASAANKMGASRQKSPGLSIEHLKLNDNVSVEDAIAELKADPMVEDAQPNFIYRAFARPTDPNYSKLWAARNTGQTIVGASYPTNNPGTTGRDLDLEEAWDNQTDCSSVLVAVVDSGVNYTHEDLASNMWDGTAQSLPNHGRDFTDSDNDPMDFNGHGTHVAGIIGAVANNAKGGAGVCWQANIVALRVLDAAGAGTTTDIVAALVFAQSLGVKVVNLSLGTSQHDASLQNALQALSNTGTVIVVAAGNDGSNNDTDAIYPCNYTSIANLICVAAVDQSFALADFSNYSGSKVHVAAPGTNIESSVTGTSSSRSLSLLSSSWSSGSGWGSGTYRLTDSSGISSNYTLLVNPTNWSSSSQHANSLNSGVYQTITTLGSSTYVTLYIQGFYGLGTGDELRVYSSNSTGSPFGSPSNLKDTWTGVPEGGAGSSFTYSYDVSNCNAGTCTVGFQIVTDASGQRNGVGLYEVAFDTLTINTASYDIYDGTSMATPYVTGLAALVWSYNPNYAASDVVAAIKDGGVSMSSLAGKTITGKAVNAQGTLNYIIAPTNVQATAE